MLVLTIIVNTRTYSHMTMMDPEGQVLRTARVPNLRAEIEKFLEGGETMEAVIETGRSSYTMVDVLEEMGVAVKIAHPLCARRGIAGRGFSVNPFSSRKGGYPRPARMSIIRN
jgi:hypothetical protein